MSAITITVLETISEKLIADISTKAITPFSLTDNSFATTYLKELIKPYLTNEKPTPLDEQTIDTLTKQLSRLFRIRAQINSQSNGLPMDNVYTYLKTEKVLLDEKPSLEEQVTVAMLQEILIKKPTISSVSNGDAVELSTQGNEAALRNYYVATRDPDSSLEILYPYTAKDPKKKYIKGQPLIHTLIECDAISLLKVLVKKIDGHINTDILECHDAYRNTPLRFAVLNRKAKAVPVLLEAGADVNENKTHTGRTAWSEACNTQNETILALLIPHVTDLFFRKFPTTKSIQTWAVENRKPEIIDALIAANKINFTETYKYQENILHVIARHSWNAAGLTNINIPAAAIHHGNKNGAVPFLYAANLQHYKLAGILITKGANVSMRVTDDNFTMLHVAASVHFVETVDLLINNGADINARTHGTGIFGGDLSVLDIAIYSSGYTDRNLPVIERLLRETNITDTLNSNISGRTPLQKAMNYNNPNVLALLIAHKDIILTNQEVNEIADKATGQVKSNKNWNKVLQALLDKKLIAEIPPAIPEKKSPDEIIAELEKKLKEQNIETARLKSLLNAKPSTNADNSTSTSTRAMQLVSGDFSSTPQSTNKNTHTTSLNNT